MAGTTAAKVNNEVLVLENNDESDISDFLHIQSSESSPAEYLICVGERIKEPWYKKLVANGAVVAQSEQEARDIAAKVEEYAKAGKSDSDSASFAPFGV